MVDLQAAWLILLFCASSWANFLLRALPPHVTHVSLRHDRSLRRCLSELLGAEVPEGTWDIASLPFSLGGLGLLSAQRIRHGANSFERVRNRHPEVADVMVRALEGRGPGIHLEGAAGARQVLVDAGFDAPGWDDLAGGLRPPPSLG